MTARAVFLGTPAFADLWYESYKKGEDALNQRNWKEAIDQFTQAIEKKGDPGVQVRTYGMNFINYHPYLKLGIAYYNLGQPDAALQSEDTTVISITDTDNALRVSDRQRLQHERVN